MSLASCLTSLKLYHSDGRKRSRPKASTVHGWLVKWRATFSGNETLRKEGIREMLEAKRVREAKRKFRAARGSNKGAKSPLSLSFFFGKKKKNRPLRPHSRSRSHSSKRSARSIATRFATSPVQSPKPSRYQQSAYHSRYRHPSRSQSRGYSSRHSSRQASYDSGRTLVRTGTVRTKQQ